MLVGAAAGVQQHEPVGGAGPAAGGAGDAGPGLAAAAAHRRRQRAVHAPRHAARAGPRLREVIAFSWVHTGCLICWSLCRELYVDDRFKESKKEKKIIRDIPTRLQKKHKIKN